MQDIGFLRRAYSDECEIYTIEIDSLFSLLRHRLVINTTKDQELHGYSFYVDMPHLNDFLWEIGRQKLPLKIEISEAVSGRTVNAKTATTAFGKDEDANYDAIIKVFDDLVKELNNLPETK